MYSTSIKLQSQLLQYEHVLHIIAMYSPCSNTLPKRFPSHTRRVLTLSPAKSVFRFVVLVPAVHEVLRGAAPLMSRHFAIEFHCHVAREVASVVNELGLQKEDTESRWIGSEVR